MIGARDLAFVGCRLLSLYVLYGVVQSLAFGSYFVLNQSLFSQGFSMAAEPNSPEKLLELGTTFVPLLTGLAAFAVLWFGARWIAEKVAGITTENAPASERTWSPETALSLAVIGLGLGLLVFTIPHIAGLLTTLLQTDPSDPRPALYTYLYNLVSVVMRCAVGVGLILGSGVIAGAIGRLRRW